MYSRPDKARIFASFPITKTPPPSWWPGDITVRPVLRITLHNIIGQTILTARPCQWFPLALLLLPARFLFFCKVQVRCPQHLEGGFLRFWNSQASVTDKSLRIYSLRVHHATFSFIFARTWDRTWTWRGYKMACGWGTVRPVFKLRINHWT